MAFWEAGFWEVGFWEVGFWYEGTSTDQSPGATNGIFSMAAKYDEYVYNKVKSNTYNTNIVHDEYKYTVDGTKIYVNKLKATVNECMKEDVIHVNKVLMRKSVKVYNYVQ